MRFLTRLLLSLVLALFTVGCEVPALIPVSTMHGLGVQAYAQAIGDKKEITGTQEAKWVQDIGRDIARVSGQKFQWEFKLLDAPQTVNAFCLPGGKVAVYSGLLKVTQNKDALAAVMGHEVAHATLQHGNKRMSQGLLLQLGMSTASAVAANWGGIDEGERNNIIALMGAGAQIGVVLPFGRKQETEADVEGLRFLIRAGYDPNAAPALWRRMAQLSAGSQTPRWLSTHPHPRDRADHLERIIPQLMAQEGRAR